MKIEQSLAIALRPQTLETLVGRAKTAESIRKYGRKPLAWMFTGPAGTGKTTIARILALSYQCKDAPFGSPSKECRAKRNLFDIQEINASQFRGVEDVEQIVEMSQYFPRAPTVKRAIILDEAQRMSVPAQNMLLQPLESGPGTTVWFICTTDPEKIIRPLKARCTSFALRPLTAKGVLSLCLRAGKAVGADAAQLEKLADECVARDTRSPRDVVQAVERLSTGLAPEIAAMGQAGEGRAFDPLALCRAVVKKNRKLVDAKLKELNADSADSTARVALGFFKSVMLGDGSIQQRAAASAVVERVASALYLDDHAKAAAIAVALWTYAYAEGVRNETGSSKWK